MYSLRQILTVTALNYRRWRKNPRIIFVFSIAAILCFLLSDKLVHFAVDNGSPMQILEPFIWTFGDHTSVFLVSLPLVLLFADIPFLGAALPFYLCRINRTKWLIGQYLYILSATVLYLCFILVSTSAFCARISFAGNKWSETAALLAYSGAGKAMSVPALPKIMELSTPLQSTGSVILLMLLYMLLLISLMMLVTICSTPYLGMIATLVFHVFGYIANPDLFRTIFRLNDQQTYIANLIAAWISPLQHATYNMHNFGYDRLPLLWQSYILFVVFTLLFVFLIQRNIKKYSFPFVREEH